MGLNASSLEKLWDRLAEHPGMENRELDLKLQLPLVIGCTSDSRPYAMVLTNQKPEPLKGLEAIEVRIGERSWSAVERWSLMFILQDWSLLHAFAEICLAFADRIRSTSSEKKALSEIYATVNQWQRLLKTIRQEESLLALRNVCGELIAALEIAKLTGKSMEKICAAWTGPYEAPQDYSFDVEHCYWEVKTIHENTKRIAISSPEQLDNTNKRIRLIAVTLNAASGDESQQLISLPRLIELIRQASDDSYEADQSISNGLYALRIDSHSDLARHTMFEIGKITTYDVSADFPRVVPEIVPKGIAGLQYEVERTVMEPFTIAIDRGVPVIAEE